jgi:hypothetical protein
MTDTRKVLDKAGMGITDGLPLETSGGDLESLRRDIQRLMDIEAIRQLKHAYFRCLDTANLEEMATLFHDDVKVHFKGGGYEWDLKGKQEYLANVGAAFSKQAVGHHNGHHPEIQLLSDTEATGIWYLADNMWILEHKFFTTGTALYWDRYEKVDGRWLIRETSYERLYEINRQLDEELPLSSHYLGVHGADASA